MTSHISPRSERSDVNSFSLARSDSLDSLHDDITSNATNFTTNFTHDVVVYGAGMAGIAAARELQAKGLSVVLLEARDRIGGRICTQPITINGTTFAAELGASWIHGTTHNPVAAMSDAAGIVRVATDMSKVAVFKAPGAQLSTWEWMVGHAAIFLFRLELFFYKLFNNRSTDGIWFVCGNGGNCTHTVVVLCRAYMCVPTFVEHPYVYTCHHHPPQSTSYNKHRQYHQHKHHKKPQTLMCKPLPTAPPSAGTCRVWVARYCRYISP